MSVSGIRSPYDALPLGLAIQGAIKAPSAISPTRYVDAVRAARGTTPTPGVRAVDPTRQTDPARAADPTRATDPARSTDPARGPERSTPVREPRPTQAPVRGTAYQTNADGDSVTLGSKFGQLTESEQRELDALKKRDLEVRQHEQAHMAAAAGLNASGPTYTFRTGPDGQRYAVGGKVNIDTSPGRTPEETIAKAQQIRRAALAPAEPSSTDRAVAARAARMETEARTELRKQEDAERAERVENTDAAKNAQGADRSSANETPSVSDAASQTGPQTDTQPNARTDARTDSASGIQPGTPGSASLQAVNENASRALGIDLIA